MGVDDMRPYELNELIGQREEIRHCIVVGTRCDQQMQELRHLVPCLSEKLAEASIEVEASILACAKDML